MCERDDLTKMTSDHSWSATRRTFVAMTLAGMSTLAGCAPVDAGGDDLIESMVTIDTPDGTMDAFFVHPAKGRHPAILTWPDIAGLRDAFMVMARRLASQGYAVLVANPYYRALKAPQFADFASFRAENGFQKVADMRAALTADAVMRDAGALVAWLDGQGAVDTARGIGTHGYCMGGPFTVFTAAAVPGRVRAASSLHGGGLVKEADPQSPHRLLNSTEAGYLFAIAQDDDAKEPEAKTVLRAFAEQADVPAEVEVYAADHGWTVIDSPAYAEAEAERAWARMSALFSERL